MKNRRAFIPSTRVGVFLFWRLPTPSWPVCSGEGWEKKVETATATCDHREKVSGSLSRGAAAQRGAG